MKPDDLRDSLVAMDLQKFDTDKFIALRNISPSPDDLPTLKGYEGDLAKLDEVRDGGGGESREEGEMGGKGGRAGWGVFSLVVRACSLKSKISRRHEPSLARDDRSIFM